MIFWAIFGWLMVAAALWEAFETIVLPRTVSRRFRITTLYFEIVWRVSRSIHRLLIHRWPKQVEGALAFIAPLSVLGLLGMWALMLVFGFGLVEFGLQLPLSSGDSSYGNYVYSSATTFLTLGYGDVVPTTYQGRVVSMIEAGVGFSVLALVIGYIPVLYQVFSERERVSLLLDARAGSPPTAGVLLDTYGDDVAGLERLLEEYERWAARLLEAYLSYPLLTLYRSQHEKLHWMAVVACLTDACVLIIEAYEGDDPAMNSLRRQAKLTYAMCRHLVIDVAYVLDLPPVDPPERLSPEDYQRLTRRLASRRAPISLENRCGALKTHRHEYEPHYQGMAEGLFMDLPSWLGDDAEPMSWEISAWDKSQHF